MAAEATREELERRLGSDGLVLLDVRSAWEFSGARGYPCDPRQGRLPGAINVDLGDLLACASPAEVRARVGAPEGAEVVAYCHSGARSATAMPLLRAAGYEARNYPGSWHEWAADLSLPVETG
jgi:thiosulfate/3-mercaptopyruvate sulfurtransferase